MFFVIAATALAALVQLRHMRGSNQITALSDPYEKQELPAFVSARQKKMPQPNIPNKVA